MKALILATLMVCSSAAPGRTIIQPNLPGTNLRDFTEPGLIIDDDGQVYQSIPGMSGAKDLSAPAYYFDGDTLYPEVVPGMRSRDFTEPSFTIKHEDDW